MLEREEGMPIRDLKDIPLPAEGIDDKISDLVRALNGLGIQTNESCEGHLDWPRKPLPRVNYSILPLTRNEPGIKERLSILKQALEEYNENRPITWIIESTYVCPTTMASTQTELEVLQKSSSALAQFIFDKHIKP